MIKLFGGRLQMSLLMIPTVAVMLWFYGVSALMGLAAAIVIHECAHAAAASALGVEVSRIELLPYGCAAVIEGLGEIKPAAEFIIAAAGPAANIVCYAIAREVANGAFGETFLSASLSLCAINLLPCAKTDGGRMLTALLSGHIKRTAAIDILAVLSVFVGTAMCAAFIYFAVEGSINITLIIFSVFMFISAYDVRKKNVISKRNKTVLRKRILKRGYAETAHHVLKEDATAAQAISAMEHNKYNIFYFVDEGMRLKGSMDETELLSRAVKSNGSTKVFKK